MKDKKDKIYYFQEKSNDILDLQDELTAEEIGIYFILKAGYFKYAGELKKENANQRCKFFGDINKFNLMINKLFDDSNGLLVNNSWLSEINDIKKLSEKRKAIAESRWNGDTKTIKNNQNKPTGLNSLNLDNNLDESILNQIKLKENETKLKTNKKQINPIYKELSDGLLFVLEAKLQKKLSSKNWEDEIRKIIEIDLKPRENPVEDVTQAIQAIANNYGKDYFPIIQSASSLREKFTKIENYISRGSKGKDFSSIHQYNSILNDLNGGFNE